MARRKTTSSRVNVVHQGQRATLNGKPVIADGKGNWVAVTKGTYGNAQYGGAKVGSYKKDENRKNTPAKAKPTKTKPPKSNNTAAVNARVQKRQNELYRAVIRSGTDTKNAQLLRPAPGRGDPKPTPTRRNVTPTPPTAPKKPAVAAPKKPAVTTPAKPAARKPRTWLKENYKPGGPPKKAVTPKKKKLTNKQRKQGGFH